MQPSRRDNTIVLQLRDRSDLLNPDPSPLFYVRIADQDLMITVQTNTQPPEGTDKLGDALGR